MKINVTGNKALISSVSVELNKIGMVIIINTTDTAEECHRAGSDVTPSGIDDPKYYSEKNFTISPLNKGMDCCVAIIGENDRDNDVLDNYTILQSYCKEQYVFMLVSPDKLEHLNTLASYK